ncbi:NlpC/P60 family protein [Nocardiopsis sp. EMB25]|uniref:C40 family peptidase n=1 Tax=Nocardiopsis TaxID=2013 RepID=UPI0004758BA0|nr:MULTISPECIES: NlpC/P60 family protein [Nocardiopsis]MCY9783516.1 NlpC/P60 family protein [Nocardiopsis sp. EMB25]
MTRNPEPRVRGRYRLATVGCAAAGAVLLSSGTALADTSQEEAQDRYEQLQRELSELNEAYNQAEQDHEAAQAELEDVEERLARAQEDLEEMSGDVVHIAQAAYTGGTHSLLGVLFDGTPDDALQSVADLDYLSAGQQVVLADYVTEVERAEDLHEEAEEAEAAAAEALEEAEAAQVDGEAALEEQAEVLADLGGVDPTSGPAAGADAAGAAPVAVSGDVQAVLDFARAQIGKSYEWGATGPDSYDCSGLVQAAWAQAGVNLPRTTYDQVNAGTRISRDEVQPGDLLFFYDESAPSHVGIYSGNGNMIHGSNPSKPLEEVALADYWDGVFTVAVRVG